MNQVNEGPTMKSGMSVSSRLHELAKLLDDAQDSVLDGEYEDANEQLGDLERGIHECRFVLHQAGDTRPMSAREGDRQ
jgi:hypothetical protein